MNETVQAQPVPPVVDKASGMAIATLVLGILAIPCCCSIFTGIPALVLGFIENGKINRGDSSPKGKWMAVLGIVMGIVSLVFFCIWILWYIFFGGMAVMEEMMRNMN